MVSEVVPQERLDFESYCQAARDILDKMDDAKWMIGELAAGLERHYRERTIDEFSIQINYEKRRVHEYCQVWRFYEQCAGAQFLRQSPALRYTHFRDAMSLSDLVGTKGVIDFLDDCIANLYTVEQARIEIQRLKGKALPTQKLAEFNNAKQAIDYLLDYEGAVRVVIFERLAINAN